MNGVFSISSLFGSPSTSPDRSADEYEKWLKEARESSQRLTREAEEAGRIMDVYTRAHKDGQRAVQDPDSDNNSEGHWLEKSGLDTCLLDDATPSCPLLAALNLRLSNTGSTAPVFGGQLPSVSVAYLIHSPYSPIRLEQQPRLCDHGTKWREAFVDLLAVQSGRELPSKCLQSTPESNVDWLRGMIELAMYKGDEHTEELSSTAGNTLRPIEQAPEPLLRLTNPRRSADDAVEDENADNDELTELDICNRLFGSQEPSSSDTAKAASRSFARLQRSSYPFDPNNRNSGILSTLTTTERTIHQDGSVSTKVVLKKRFSDGREESTETMHHQNAVPQMQEAALKSFKDEGFSKTSQDKEIKESKSRGWFWS